MQATSPDPAVTTAPFGRSDSRKRQTGYPHVGPAVGDYGLSIDANAYS